MRLFYSVHLNSSKILDKSAPPPSGGGWVGAGSFVEENTGSYSTPYRFTSKELDDETGLYYYGARYYDPKLSMFLGVDPLSDISPNESPFAYCKNNPIILVDPDGRNAGWYNDGSGTPQYNKDVHSQKDMDDNNIKGTYLGEKGTGTDPISGKAITSYNADGSKTPITSTLPTAEVTAADPYKSTRHLYADDKGYGPYNPTALGLEVGGSFTIPIGPFTHTYNLSFGIIITNWNAGIFATLENQTGMNLPLWGPGCSIGVFGSEYSGILGSPPSLKYFTGEAIGNQLNLGGFGLFQNTSSNATKPTPGFVTSGLQFNISPNIGYSRTISKTGMVLKFRNPLIRN